MASPKLFTKEFNPSLAPVQLAQPGGSPLGVGGGGKMAGSAVAAAAAAAAGKGFPLNLGGGKTGGFNVTPQLIQQLLASASKVRC